MMGFLSPFSYSNLYLQVILALCLYLPLSILRIPAIFLHGLHTYVHPDDVAPAGGSGGIRAAIRRPGAEVSESELKPRKRSKDKVEFDEQKAQIFRLKLNEPHLGTRLYFSEFRSAFSSTIVALGCFILQNFISEENSGALKNGAIIPTLLGLSGIARLLVLIVKIAFERAASRRSEKQMSVLLGLLGFLFGVAIMFDIIPNRILDFDKKSFDGFARSLTAILMGFIAGALYIPATRNARSFWLGTDQIRCNLSIIQCGQASRMLLYANFLCTTVASVIRIIPFSEVVKRNLGMSSSDLEKLRIWSLLGSGLLQFLAIRPNLQMYLNEGVLSWYQRLHGGKVPELDYSRAKVFLHNHFLCLVALQFFTPAAFILLFSGLSQMVWTQIPMWGLVREVCLIMGWWINLVWFTFTSANILLYRHGFLYVS